MGVWSCSYTQRPEEVTVSKQTRHCPWAHLSARSALCSVEIWVTEITSHTVCDILRLWNRCVEDFYELVCVRTWTMQMLHYYLWNVFLKRQLVSVMWHYLITIKTRCRILFSHNWPLNKLKQANNAWSVKSSHCLFYEGEQWYKHNTRIFLCPCRGS